LPFLVLLRRSLCFNKYYDHNIVPNEVFSELRRSDIMGVIQCRLDKEIYKWKKIRTRINADVADFYTNFNSDKSESKINAVNDFQ